MKRIKQALFVALIALIGYIGYISFLSTDNSTDAVNLVPQDAVYILKTRKPIKAWKKFSQSDLWQHMKTYSEFKEIAESADAIDQMIDENRALFKMFALKNLIISAHVTRASDYDFLFLTDLSKASKSDWVKNNLDKLFSLADYQVRKQDYKGTVINICKDRADGSNLYVAAVANYLACSYNLGILKKSIDEYYNPVLKDKAAYHFVEEETATDGLAQFYINYAYLEPFLRIYMGTVDPSIRDILGQMHFSGLNGELEDSYLKLKGKTLINDSMDEVLTVLSKSGSSKLGVHKVLSERTALLMRLGFDDFKTFTEQSLALGSARGQQINNRNLKLIELFMGISIQEDFLNWIGDELAVAQYFNEDLRGNKVPRLVAIKVKDKREAREKLDRVFKKVKRRLPFKFDEYEFKGYDIKYMETKGLFRLVFGKLFDRVEKPYFCFIDDYVIFCDDAKTLLQTILDYEEDRTLSDESNFRFVNQDLDRKSSFFTYISPRLYFNNLSAVLSTRSFEELKKNPQYVTCFNGTAFLMKAEGEGVFTTQLGSNFLKESIEIVADENREEDEWEELDEIEHFIIEKLNGKAIKKYYSSGKLLSVQAVNDAMKPDGVYTEYWENERVKVKGRYKKGEAAGVWRYYNEKGKLIEKNRIR